GGTAERRVALNLEVRECLAELRADDRILEERLPVARQLLRRLHELVEGHEIARDTTEGIRAALVAERRLRDLPAARELADEVGFLGARVRHEDFREERAPGDLLERPHVDAGMPRVDEEAG